MECKMIHFVLAGVCLLMLCINIPGIIGGDKMSILAAVICCGSALTCIVNGIIAK
jgi:hypothetical protein